MIRLASAVAFLLSINSASGFSSAIKTAHRFSTKIAYHPTSFDRAVDCVNTYGECDVEELVSLAEGMCTSNFSDR